MTRGTLVVVWLLAGYAGGGRLASSQSPRGGVTRLGAADAYGPGITTVSAGQVQFTLARAGRRAPPPGADLGDSVSTPPAFWLVIVSDVATNASEVRTRLQAMKLEFPSVKAELEALPKALVAKRAGSWAAYYAPAGR